MKEISPQKSKCSASWLEHNDVSGCLRVTISNLEIISIIESKEKGLLKSTYSFWLILGYLYETQVENTFRQLISDQHDKYR